MVINMKFKKLAKDLFHKFHMKWPCMIMSARFCLWYGPRQANLLLIAYASSEGSGARTFAARSYKQWVKRNLQTESQIPGPSEWLGMRI